MASPKQQNEVLLTLLLKWLSNKPQKPKLYLEKSLQTWFNKCKIQANCSVEETLADESVVIKIKPPPAVNELQRLKGETLMQKDGTKTVTILSVSLGSPEMDTQMGDNAAAKAPPPASLINTKPSMSELIAAKVPFEGQKDSVAVAGNPPQDDRKRSDDSLVPVGLYWYVSQIYKKEIRLIEKETKVTIIPNVSVRFESEEEDGKPNEASARFTDLVQKCLPDSIDSLVIPLKFVDPDQWDNALKVITNNKNKLLVTMISEEMTICGPKHCQNSLSSTLNAMQNSSTTFEEPERPSLSQHFNDDVCLKISMTIKDDLAKTGLTIGEDQWKNLTTSYDYRLAQMMFKYNVDFQKSSFSEGKVNIKASYKGSGGNAAMESHALRALLRLYQRMITSPLRLPPPYGAAGFGGSEEASSGAGLNGHSAQNSQESTVGGAAGDSKDDRCSICLSEFTKKTQLKCKHEFCEECLQTAVKHSGPICPICKNVFGVMKGNQPDGIMTWHKNSFSLPGFQSCGQICITYDIPGGKQMENHPNPGQYYSGTTRHAYLPDNKEGNEVLQLLKKAFDQKLIFTIGASRTTGVDNMVTWNDIHHKTSTRGGPEGYGYPDENYLSRVKDELKAKGIQ